MKLRVIESHWTLFIDALCARRDVETAGIVLAERLGGGAVLLARQMIPLPDEGYSIRRADQLRIDPVALNRLVRPARDSGLSVITVHTHPGTSRPWFSAADDAGDSRLIPSLFTQMEGPHGSIVIAGDSRLPVARIWRGSEGPTEMGVSIVGRTLLVPVAQGGDGVSSPWFDRQRLALGAAGQAALRNIHVAIVGLGGTGSVVFLQLAHLGVGIHWRHNNHFIHYGGAGLGMFGALGYVSRKDERLSGHQATLFQFDEDAKRASTNKLVEQIAPIVHCTEGGITFADLFARTCNLSPASAEIYRDAIDILREHKEIKVVSGKSGKATAARVQDEDRLAVPPQRNLFVRRRQF